MYLLIEIRQGVLKQCHVINVGVKKVQLTLFESDIFMGVLRSDFQRFRCPNEARAPCWLRLCIEESMRLTLKYISNLLRYIL